MKNLKNFEIISAIGTIVFGSLLHFVFAWSAQWYPMALIAAVNESTWEHLKLAFWPALIFTVIFYFAFKPEIKNFCFAQMVKLISMPLMIVGLFYGWLLFFQDNFIYDILIFVVAVILGHIFSFYIEKSEKEFNLNATSAVVITLLILAFSLLTYFPPRNFLFQDPVTEGYGIIKIIN